VAFGTVFSTLAELVHLLWKALLPKPAFLVIASMGGLIGLLMLRKYGVRASKGSSILKEISLLRIASSRGE
jgi:pimeloyl-ACP methyl ester carboxylesterase